MSDAPNYRALSPPSTKPRDEYSYVERRAELYDMIEQAGTYRNLQRSTRELGDRYGVSHTQIQKDIRRILSWKADHLGDYTEAELETLKTKAVQDALENGDSGRAYDIISQHLQNLMALGAKDKAPEKIEHQEGEGSDFGPTIIFEDSDGDGE